MKIAISIIVHNSKQRPNGHFFLNRLIDSIHAIETDIYHVAVVDNSSIPEIPYEILEKIKKFNSYSIDRIDDQSIEGLSGGWNLALDRSRSKDPDILIYINDDVILTNDIAELVKLYKEDKDSHITVYGPVTDNHGTGVRLQRKENLPKYFHLAIPNEDWSELNIKAREEWIS